LSNALQELEDAMANKNQWFHKAQENVRTITRLKIDDKNEDV
jgi:hypothetical protein